MTIRKEEDSDFKQVSDVVADAFRDEIHSDHTEQFLVERIRNGDSFVPELSLVATEGKQVVGYVLLSKISIIDEEKNAHLSLALAPIAVRRSHQGKGIGGTLISAAHQKARELGFGSVVLLGHETYYPRFGYEPAGAYRISLPFDVPAENCMVIELIPGALRNVSGMVQYPQAFEG